MTEINYSSTRYYLTNSIRSLEILRESIQSHSNIDETIESEVEYWITTLELIRGHLHGCEYNYKGNINVADAIKEVQEELAGAFKYIYKFLTNKERKLLADSWQYCKEARDTVKWLKSQ